MILDSDLAKLYKCTNGTKDINKAVNRNKDRFPEDFYFQLTEKILKFQNGTSSTEVEHTHGGVRKLPFVFTEQGVAMLSSALKTKIASKISVSIMRAFVKMRKYISNNLLKLNNHSDMLIDHEGRIKVLENTFSKFNTISNELFFEGEIYDAHSLLLDIFNSSNKSITIIDNYISKELLDVLSKTNKQIIVHTKNIDNNLINKYKQQYNNITIKINKSFHDRFIIIDNTCLYHCGASFKDLGKKCFCISKIDNIEIIKEINKKL